MMGDTIAYAYNNRSELTNAVAAVDSDYRYAYDFDDIGNRETAAECGTNVLYSANNLNQYTAVDDFQPQFDDDGNQTLIKTETGIWFVAYNGENRPINWSNGATNIVMSFDRMGRRVTKNHQRFVYDGYLQIADNSGSVYVWDQTELGATRPHVWKHGISVEYYTHDGNKNVSEVVTIGGVVSAHYEYAPFGVVMAQRSIVDNENPWQFSSECADNETGLVYYNFRHYNFGDGCWCCRDRNDDYLDFYSAKPHASTISRFCDNNPVLFWDRLGDVVAAPLGVLPNSSICCEDKSTTRNPFHEVFGNGYSMPCCPGGLVVTEMSNCTCLGCATGMDRETLISQGGCLPESANDGPGDAFRHCVWSCMMSRRCGSACALIATSYHELGIEDWKWNYEGAASNMDLYNNMIGLGVASGGSTCESGCLDRLYSGQLSIINKRALPSRDVVEDCIKQKQK